MRLASQVFQPLYTPKLFMDMRLDESRRVYISADCVDNYYSEMVVILSKEKDNSAKEETLEIV